MIIIVSGASHTGKTLLAQKLLEKYKYPCLSIDHLKMGLIRSGNTSLTPEDDDKLTEYLWPIVSEMIKTAIENNQNMIVEGCYITHDWKKSFSDEYLEHIRYICLVMSEEYIRKHFTDIKAHGKDIENRLYDDIDIDDLIRDNEAYLEGCKANDDRYLLIDETYNVDESIII
ncbi:MAG: AAA family ATPase [Ruminiclostridium sp.]|nr:AAA family ATPase [Ruminiclostridium sp.]